MKRYEFFCSYDGGGPADEQETEGGEFVRFSDAEAAVKQARIDALEEAKQAVSSEEILDAEDNADDSYNCGVLDCVRAVEKLKGKTP